jgi:hypothetical protein
MSQAAPPVQPALVTGLHSTPVPASFAATRLTQLPADGGVAGRVHSNGLVWPASPELDDPDPEPEDPIDDLALEDEPVPLPP